MSEPAAVDEVQLEYVDDTGERVQTSFGAARADAVVAGLPVRRFPSYAGMGHYPGALWTVTTQGFVGYESLLERDRVWLADFDPDVAGIASQPFAMRGTDGGLTRHHIPDFLLTTADGTVTVVDVKPQRLLTKPRVRASLGWTGRVVAARGWRYEVWTGTSPVLLTNIRFLSAGRRVEFVDADRVRALTAAARVGVDLATLEDRTGLRGDAGGRAALLALLWAQVVQVDLFQPIGPHSVITGIRTDRVHA